ncbi:MAG: type II toxin-antitoxin system RelB/DinJ family antitoxin [Desulfarculales bacterium]|jgi:DNA-damage-inducible protein J|nr:type II toxin-antitoxin system RelB/DinJ family antitoxin [Desulfarculales bacterium]
MAVQTDLVSARVERQVKDRAQANLKTMGLTISDAIRIVLARVADKKTVPAELFLNQDEYDSWFKAKVYEALEEEGEGTPHDEVIGKARQIIAENARNAQKNKI